MKSFLHLVVGHPYLVLLTSGFLERVGAPLLFSPVLVAAGALAAALGRLTDARSFKLVAFQRLAHSM